MFPVLGTIGEGLKAVLRFARTCKLFTCALILVPCLGAAAKGFASLPLPEVLARPSTIWLVDTAVMVLLVPAWVALYRFAILNDQDRGWWPVDMRMRRVAMAMVTLSLLSLIGAAPFAIALDVLPRLGPRRLVVAVAIVVAIMVKLGTLLLAARLAIAPAMAATGTKPQALDVAFGYSRRNAFRILWTRLLVYLPVFAVTGAFALADRFFGDPQGRVTVLAVTDIVVTTLLTSVTELVDGAVFARVAVALVKGQRARAAEEARKAREGTHDD